MLNYIDIFSNQANRKQSMNYGCIVENEETNEVFNHLVFLDSYSVLLKLKIMINLSFLICRSCIMWKSQAHL